MSKLFFVFVHLLTVKSFFRSVFAFRCLCEYWCAPSLATSSSRPMFPSQEGDSTVWVWGDHNTHVLYLSQTHTRTHTHTYTHAHAHTHTHTHVKYERQDFSLLWMVLHTPRMCLSTKEKKRVDLRNVRPKASCLTFFPSSFFPLYKFLRCVRESALERGGNMRERWCFPSCFTDAKVRELELHVSSCIVCCIELLSANFLVVVVFECHKYLTDDFKSRGIWLDRRGS